MSPDLSAKINKVTGEHLRAARKMRRLSQQDVERMTDGEFKSSILGAYERGDRAITVDRLCRLAQVYDVVCADLLPVTPAVLPPLGIRVEAVGWTTDVLEVRKIGESATSAIVKIDGKVTMEVPKSRLHKL